MMIDYVTIITYYYYIIDGMITISCCFAWHFEALFSFTDVRIY